MTILKHVPNALTIIRFLLIPYIIVLIFQEQYILAFIILTISGITDILDGVIARRFNLVTDFGKLVDPLADKSTQISILVVLMIKGIIPFWIILILFVKELLMVAGASFLYGKEFVVSSKWYGKVATVLFYIAIVFSLLIRYFKCPYSFDIYIYYLATLAAIFSLIMYFKKFYVRDFLKKNA